MAIYEIFWSPTGGTKKVSDYVCEKLGCDVKSVDLIKNPDAAKKLSLEENDVCFIAAPSFGGRVPEPEMKLLKEIKPNGARAVLMAVYGNRHIDDTLTEMSDELKKTGFRCSAALEAVAEHSLARIYGAGRPDEDDRKELNSFGETIKKAIAENTISDDVEVPGSHDYKVFNSPPIKPIVSDKCVKCRKCAKECPTGAIPMDAPNTTDAEKCIACMHCVSVCPMGARSVLPEMTKAMEERLASRCQGRKENKLYI